MALRVHSGVALRQTSFLPSSVSAPSALILRRPKSCFSAPFKHCSPLRVQCAAGFKESETAQSVKIPAKYDEKELPPLLASMAIKGFPPCRESKYADEALACIKNNWPSNWSGLDPFYQLCNSYISFAHCSTVSHDRLSAIAISCALLTILDDILDNMQNDLLLEKVGIDHNILGSPRSIKEYFHSLDVVLRQEEPLQNPTPMQEMIWKLGCDLRELSNPEWFKLYADAMLVFYNKNLENYAADLAGDHIDITDVESYTRIRLRTNGGGMDNLAVEFCNNLFLPTEIREHPLIQQLSTAAWTYSTYANDIFSYSKEKDEPHALNLIKVIMKSEGMSLPQAAWRAVNLANSVAKGFMELETQLSMWEEEPWGLAVSRYVQGLKEAMAGKLYWYSLQKRYRHLNAPFPELRDVNVSFTPKAEHFKCMYLTWCAGNDNSDIVN